MRNPRRTASTAAALMIGLGLVSFVTILAASLKVSFAATLDRSMKADYIIEGEFGINQVPDPSSAALAVIAGALILRRR